MSIQVIGFSNSKPPKRRHDQRHVLHADQRLMAVRAPGISMPCFCSPQLQRLAAARGRTGAAGPGPWSEGPVSSGSSVSIISSVSLASKSCLANNDVRHSMASNPPWIHHPMFNTVNPNWMKRYEKKKHVILLLYTVNYIK